MSLVLILQPWDENTTNDITEYTDTPHGNVTTIGTGDTPGTAQHNL